MYETNEEMRESVGHDGMKIWSKEKLTGSRGLKESMTDQGIKTLTDWTTDRRV